MTLEGPAAGCGDGPKPSIQVMPSAHPDAGAISIGVPVRIDQDFSNPF
jgi:hypothetical protein